MPVPTYLASVELLFKQGNATEHRYRPALKTLFETVLADVTATNEPKQAEYGAPDFVIQQRHVPIGHVEAKDIGVALDKSIADSQRDLPKTPNGKQLKRYRAALPNLLYTDGLVWHWFVEGEPRLNAPIVLASWEPGTQKLHHHPTAAHDLTTLLHQFAAYTAAPLVGTPHDLAQRLAQVARWLDEVINIVLQDEQAHGSLHQQIEAFRQTLLPTITASEFADMYAQTLVYGLFAARVATPDRPHFTRYDAAYAIPKTNPFLQELFHMMAGPRLDERIAWLVDDCARLLERTDMSEVLRDFGKASQQEDPVVHFYETFLAAYDPRTREMRGVYYTPEPVVSYMVRSVDHLLQTRFGKPLGLADGDTIVLDPATGTATFLHAVVQHIHATLQNMGMADAWNQYVPTKLLPRIHGCELLMAPYTIAHLKLSVLLQQSGYMFGSDERIGIYLTNALSDALVGQHIMPFAQFIAEEGKAADDVKHEKPVMVVLGNPPYAVNSANKGIWERPIREHYYPRDSIKEQNPRLLLDDYVKFLRFGQWRIQQTGKGVLAFITNHGYLDNPTFRGMRHALLQTFDTLYLLNLHGNAKKKETSPDGSKDENVFDIQQGVAIGIFVKDAEQQFPCRVFYADLWGKREDKQKESSGKYPWLLTHTVKTTDWQELAPQAPFFFFVPHNIDRLPEYEQGWKITDAFMMHSSGIKTHRDHFVLAYDQSTLEKRIADFRNSAIADTTIQHQYHLHDTSEWKLPKQRQSLQADEHWCEHFTPCLYRPFDMQALYYHPEVIERPRPEIMHHMVQGNNIGVITVRQVAENTFNHVLVTDCIVDCRITLSNKGAGYLFPLYLYPAEDDMFAAENRRPNLSDDVIRDITQRLQLTFIPDGAGDLTSTIGPEDILHYFYAVLHSPTYRSRYAELLKIDFPRIPITSDNALFKTLAAYGAMLVDLHLLRLPGSGGVGGAGGAPALNKPTEQGITQHGVTTGAIEKVRYHEQQQRVIIGNGRSFAGIEPDTWAMQMGGYQPLQKWLKDRKGRTLSFDDAQHYMRMVIALRETQRLMAEIDAAVGAWPLA